MVFCRPTFIPSWFCWVFFFSWLTETHCMYAFMPNQSMKKKIVATAPYVKLAKGLNIERQVGIQCINFIFSLGGCGTRKPADSPRAVLGNRRLNDIVLCHNLCYCRVVVVFIYAFRKERGFKKNKFSKRDGQGRQFLDTSVYCFYFWDETELYEL